MPNEKKNSLMHIAGEFDSAKIMFRILHVFHVSPVAMGDNGYLQP